MIENTILKKNRQGLKALVFALPFPSTELIELAARAGFDGTVVAHNEKLVDKPELLTRDAFGDGWMLIVRPAGDDWQTGLVTGAAIGPTIDSWIAGGAYKERTG